MVDRELAFLSAHALAHRIRRKDVSPVEVVRNCLLRIEQVQPKVNCFCFTYPEEAMEAARRAESAVASHEPLGALHGVPIAIKDMTPTRGKPTTLGSRTHKDWVPDYDAVVVERLLAAGAILIGKTTTPEFALAGFTESSLWGATRNPWNLQHSSGGSSGGSAVAVATGCVALAEGSDMGGSVRIPAALCGIVGLKPSFGRIPYDILPSLDNFCHFGPLARCVDDAALFLSCTQGPDDRDLFSLPPGPEISLPIASDLRGFTVALSKDLGYFSVDPEVGANTYAAAELIRQQGARVEEVNLDWTSDINHAGWRHIWVTAAQMAGPYLNDSRELLDPATVLSAEDGLKVSGLDLKNVEEVRQAQWRKLAPILQKCDALICPTMPLPAPLLGATDRDYGAMDDDGYHDFEMTLPFNLVSPCPVLTVPSGFTKSGLPTGLQIVGRRYDESTVFRVGAALEEARGGNRNQPMI